jgi:DNA polymerase-3 subunit delta
MKISGRAEGFVAKPDPAVRAVLVYGPDTGLVRERLNKMTRAVAGSVDDPFRVIEIPADALRDDPARLRDEAAAISFGGGRRVVRVRDAGDTLAELFESFDDDAMGDALVVVTAGDLSPRSKLRGVFEAGKRIAALPCYADDDAMVGSVAREMLKAAGLAIHSDALSWLVNHLGGDRELSRRELEKLILYKGGPGTVTEEDVLACVGDTAGFAVDDLIYALADGDQTTMQRVYGRLVNEGASAMSLLTMVSRHLSRLHETRGRMSDGKSADAAAAMLRPPVFFKFKTRFTSQANRWNESLLARGLEIVSEAEMQAKSTDIPTEAVIERAFMQLAQVGRGAQRR